ncbi:MAG TPA: replication-relaxation family protein [Candidatus Saccharimonadia bacterium]|nr:replication-relaxation family protein [Candidatus Saccharimonadia bacterium]
MNKSEPRYRRPLTTEQVEILELLYKFRFATVVVLKEYFAGTNPGMDVFRRLARLEAQGFIGKRHLQDYQLLHKPVIYYLLPAGARKIAEYRDEDDVDSINVKSIYRDGTVREQFIMHSLTIFKLFNHLTVRYGEVLGFFSKADQASFENFPRQKPDAYITLQTKSGVRRFFLDFLDAAHSLIEASRKSEQYLNYHSSRNWAAIDSEFPKVIFICGSDDIAEKVQKRCRAILNKAWIRDMELMAMTSDQIELSD